MRFKTCTFLSNISYSFKIFQILKCISKLKDFSLPTAWNFLTEKINMDSSDASNLLIVNVFARNHVFFPSSGNYVIFKRSLNVQILT